jgi:hypothetical protein
MKKLGGWGEISAAGSHSGAISKPTYVLSIFAQAFSYAPWMPLSPNLSSMDETARKTARNQYVVMDDNIGAKLASMVTSMDAAMAKDNG